MTIDGIHNLHNADRQNVALFVKQIKAVTAKAQNQVIKHEDQFRGRLLDIKA